MNNKKRWPLERVLFALAGSSGLNAKRVTV